MNSGKEHQDRYRYNCKEITRTKRGLLNMIIVKFSCQVICAAQLTVYVYSVFCIRYSSYFQLDVLNVSRDTPQCYC